MEKYYGDERTRRFAEIRNDLLILKLAATGIEIKNKLTAEEIHETPSLGKVLAALEDVMQEMGWGKPISSEGDYTSGSQRPISD